MAKNKITPQEVQKIADLAKLKLTSKEISLFASQLASILSYISQLSKVNTQNVSPTTQIHNLFNITRKDNPDKSLEQKQALNQASKTQAPYFLTKAVINNWTKWTKN